jgi:hypothetical protein
MSLGTDDETARQQSTYQRLLPWCAGQGVWYFNLVKQFRAILGDTH